MILLDGKSLSKKIILELSNELKKIISLNLRKPHLAAILVGNNPASKTYIAAKEKACNETGFDSTIIHLDESVSQDELINKISQINLDSTIDGLIVQLPLPNHIDEFLVTNSISSKKDVDGFHPVNLGKMTLGTPSFLPATPFGIITLIEEYSIQTSGKNCLVIGRSNIVGRPISILMSRNTKFANATVTLAHSKTKNIERLTKTADIIIVALGRENFLNGDMVKKGVVIIDVGINRIKSNKTKSGWRLVGDVDFDSVKEKASFLTPVPGGVGPMTIVSLLKNTFLAYKNKNYQNIKK
jgi:methylenetetrahydrofolate dehydrogenase (NADP+)/methenyltetrahydrofolate cyclohydrolase